MRQMFPETAGTGKDIGSRYMKSKTWISLITLAAAAVILKYYVAEYSGNRRIAEEAIPQKETDPSFAREEKTENSSAGLSLDGQKTIRVLLKTNGFEGQFHENPEITGTGDFTVSQGTNCFYCQAGEIFSADTFFEKDGIWREEPLVLSSAEEEGELRILNLERNQSPPEYPGKLEIISREEGYLIINEVSLEEYLPRVLSSEMNRSFPKEALKAQAVSARSYAIGRLEAGDILAGGAVLDDSVSYQVYNNMPPDEETVEAMRETDGLVLKNPEGLAEINYYSTSCGVTEQDYFETEEDFSRFILEGRDTDPEYQEPWYRWSAVLTAEEIRQNLTEMGFEVPDAVTGISVTKRSGNGQALSLEVLGESFSVFISGEYDIRQALAPGTDVTLQDGSICEPMGMLPSAWFIAGKEETPKENPENSENIWILTGGGYGHGRGMSQNGAAVMARQGSDFREILTFYYPQTRVEEF